LFLPDVTLYIFVAHESTHAQQKRSATYVLPQEIIDPGPIADNEETNGVAMNLLAASSGVSEE